MKSLFGFLIWGGLVPRFVHAQKGIRYSQSTRAGTAATGQRPRAVRYCSSSDDLDQTLELTKIGRNPRGNGGRTAEEAGNSLTNTVSVVGTGPLTPGVTYEFWLTGHNSRGDGPESPNVTHTVIVVPPPPPPGPPGP